MSEAASLKLRDFIYLDTERLKSLLAQLDRGLLDARTDSSGSSKGGEVKGGFSVPLLAEVGGTAQYVATDQATETRTLHDFVFNEVEERLLELGRIMSLPEDFSGMRFIDDELRNKLSTTGYVRVRGKVAISDYKHVLSLLENANDISAASTEMEFRDRIQAASGNQVNVVRQAMRDKIASNKIDEKLVKNLKKIFDVFVLDRLVVRLFPFPEDRNLRIVGLLQRQLLRESLDDIRFKFGSSPATEWTIFGQIAAVPQESEENESLDLEFTNAIEQGLYSMAKGFSSLEDLFRVKFPEIVITPIALYRE